jgi:beta-glucosidase
VRIPSSVPRWPLRRSAASKALRSERRAIAGPKHFAGYGAALGGRDYDEVNLSDAELWNVYFPPFIAAIEAGAGNVMTAYMDLNGIPATGNRWLFTDVLRGAFGFQGFVVSDANAVRNLVTHGFAADHADAGARAVAAGIDMEMAMVEPAYAHLPSAVESGALAQEVLDVSVRRVLEAKLRMGLFDEAFVDEDRARAVLADPAHREVARIAAERSAVLLRNSGDLLPLDAAVLGSVAVLGPLADSPRDTLGPWVFDFDLEETVTVLDGIRAKVGDQVIGEAASRSSLELPGRQLELLQAVVATGTPVVLLVMNGRPLDLRWAAEAVPSILDIWYPGTQGGTAAANLLFGDVSPGGKLPFSWPRTVGQVPMVYSNTTSHEPENQARRYWDEQSTPLFPFGHGLSYSQFDYADLTLDRDSIAADRRSRWR